MNRKHIINMARIWFSHAFGNRNANQKEACEVMGWYYLMLATMKDLA